MLSVNKVTNAVSSAAKTLCSNVISNPCTIKTTTSPSTFHIPQYLYHLTSESNLKKILASGELKVSTWEQGANSLPGVYMIDKANFFKKWFGFTIPEVFGDIDIGKTLLMWIGCAPKEKMCAIKIPTGKINNDNLRFRPFYSVCKNFILSNNQRETCTRGLPLSALSEYITKEPVEYVYKQNIPTSLFAGIKSSLLNDLSPQHILDLFA